MGRGKLRVGEMGTRTFDLKVVDTRGNPVSGLSAKFGATGTSRDTHQRLSMPRQERGVHRVVLPLGSWTVEFSHGSSLRPGPIAIERFEIRESDPEGMTVELVLDLGTRLTVSFDSVVEGGAGITVLRIEQLFDESGRTSMMRVPRPSSSWSWFHVPNGTWEVSVDLGVGEPITKVIEVQGVHVEVRF
jgi:hypothetical protein